METVEHRTRFEPTDLESRKVILTGVAIFVSTMAVAGLMYLAFVLLAHARQQQGALMQRQGAIPRELPPEPRLQSSPRSDFQAYRAAQLGQLNSYQWIDRNRGIVAIPIQRAIDLLAQRGIPPQKAPSSLMLYPPSAGTRRTGFEGKVEPEPR